MSKNKRRRRPLKTNKSDLVHEEMFDDSDKPAKVGCTCKQDGRTHGGGWIQCTDNDCTVWHCIDDITDNYVLLDDEIDDLQDSNHTFKCILHGFYRMKIGNKSLYKSEDSESNDKNEETYKPPTNTNTNSIKQKRKRKTQIENENEKEIQTENGISNTIITKSDIESKPPLHKKRKIDLSLIPPLEPMNQQKFTYSNAELANPHIIYGKNIYQINKNELKQLCRKMGLKVTGTKSELINSLLKPKKSEVKTFVNHENNNNNNNNNNNDDANMIENVNKILTDNNTQQNEQQNGEQNEEKNNDNNDGDNDTNMSENVPILTDNNTEQNEQENEGTNTEQNEEKDNDNDNNMIENEEQNKEQNEQQNEETNTEENEEENEKQNEEQNEEKDNDNNNNNNDNNMIENEGKNKEQNEQNEQQNEEQNEEQNKEQNEEQNEEQNGDLISTVNDC